MLAVANRSLPRTDGPFPGNYGDVGCVTDEGELERSFEISSFLIGLVSNMCMQDQAAI